MATSALTTAIGALALIVAPLALAQTQRTGNADARVMQQLQQVTSERAALQAENAKLKQDLEQLRKDLGQATAARASLESRNKALTANANRGDATSKQTEEQLEHTRSQMQELIAKFRQTAQTLKDVDTERATVRSQLAAQQRDYKTCVDRSAALYNLNTEILDRMDGRGFWSSVAEHEPFTKIKRVELDNLIEDYRYRADELRVAAQQKKDADGG
ncbi:MAG TPA: hypothetical protein VKB34_05395 [Povalibacter sp.]|nr:hypothetical protein [Povalibacter sp.]